MAKKVEMIFEDVSKSTMKITVDNIKDDLTEGTVKTAMQAIIEKDIFETKNGSLSVISDAKIVEITETDLNVEV